MCRETKEYKIGVQDFMEEMKLAVADYFVAKVSERNGDIRITFANNQSFKLTISKEA